MGKINTKTKNGRGQWRATPLYQVWLDIKKRCLNANHAHYLAYGGRGISICEEWLHDSQAFLQWAVANGYRKGLQIDRIFNNGNYTPSNCRFVTPRENSSNRRTNNEIVGVGWHKGLGKWEAQIKYHKKTHNLGYYRDKRIAAFAYQLAIACINLH